MFDAFVGLPFADKGRSRLGCDCWGLVRLVYADLLGVELPSYDETYVTAADRDAISGLIAGRRTGWREVSEAEARPLDLLLMKEAGVDRHVGVFVRRGLVLHVSQVTRASVIQSYHSLLLRHSVSGFYRHESQA